MSAPGQLQLGLGAPPHSPPGAWVCGLCHCQRPEHLFWCSHLADHDQRERLHRLLDSCEDATMGNPDPAGSRRRIAALLEAMAADPAREWSAEDAAEQAESTIAAVRQVLLRAERAGKLERISRGRYRWAGEAQPAPAPEDEDEDEATETPPAQPDRPAPDVLARLRWLADGRLAGHLDDGGFARNALEALGHTREAIEGRP